MEAEHWKPTLEAAHQAGHDLIGIVLTRGDEAERARPEDFYRIGTVGRIHRVHPTDGNVQVLVECIQRFEIRQMLSNEAPFTARVEYMSEPVGKPDSDLKAYALAVINTIKELLPLNPLYGEELKLYSSTGSGRTTPPTWPTSPPA